MPQHGKHRPHVDSRIVSIAAAMAKDHPEDSLASTVAENVAKSALQFVCAATLLRDACELMIEVKAEKASGSYNQRMHGVFTHMSRMIEESMSADLRENLEVIVLLGAALTDRDEAKESLHRIARGFGLSTAGLSVCEDAAVLEVQDTARRRKSRAPND
jgi:hypothetical protein